MNGFKKVYSHLQPAYDSNRVELLNAAKKIFGEKGDHSVTERTVEEEFFEYFDFSQKLYDQILNNLSKKHLQIIQNANMELHKKNIGVRDYSYTKSYMLTKDEATTALHFGLRVDAFSTAKNYPGKYEDAFSKTRMSLKVVNEFYDEHDVNYSMYDKDLYLSPDYAMAGCDMQVVYQAIKFFVEKQKALTAAGIVERPTFYLMMGMPGAGKSTLAAKLNAEVYSSDSIRKELTGDVSGETKGAIEFRVMNLRTQQALMAGLDAVCDATALNKKSRAAAMKNVSGVPHKTVGLFFNCLREDSDKRNMNPDRDKHVPVDGLERLWNTIEIPTLDEGFDEIYDIVIPV